MKGMGIYKSICTLIILIVLNISCDALDSKTEAAINIFKDAILTASPEKFKKIVDNNGIVIIRNFVSGSYGARGQNIRDFYLRESLPAKLEFPVKNEIPFALRELFFESVTSKNITCKFLNLKMIKITKHEPATLEIVEFCKNILLEVSQKTYNPILVNLDGGFILAHAEIVDQWPVGAFALFEESKDQYYIRAMFDFR